MLPEGPRITVVGGGFAGTEAAWAAANRGVPVRLFEMRPKVATEVHQTDLLAEMVCSNSFKSQNPDSPAGQLKAEMRALGSLMIPTAEACAVPGGDALCVDRNAFAARMTEAIAVHPLIETVREEWISPDSSEPLIICSGPLTSSRLSQWIEEKTGVGRLFFYDAVSPTVEAHSINMGIAWEQDRYDKGDGSYINCPFDKEQYEQFVDALLAADQASSHIPDEAKYFEGCMPIEEIATRGRDSLRFGNFKPVGLTNPHTGKRAYAVLQLRQENIEKSLYSMVACQTRLKWGDQTRIFRLIPGLEQAEFVRLGVMHRNTYLDSPRILDSNLRLRSSSPPTYFAGQITGVEGYVESGATGILAGCFAASQLMDHPVESPPRATALGCLLSHVTNEIAPEFNPMNINWGLFPEVEVKDKFERRKRKLESARSAFAEWLESVRNQREAMT
ncbi:MAG: methylenetetrahydrofolate--tRNA-(uracil(54)-C(5))-methyltransferase (FADH(2)-oxidizing) TrmFO [Fimbriimonadales bacterium]